MTVSAFDTEETLEFNRARGERITGLVTALRDSGLEIETALDTGCGYGFFTGLLLDLGLHVTAVDGREENVQETRERHPEATTVICDVESPDLRRLSPSDLVLCVGLMYHLENPLIALRNLACLTSQVIILESLCAPGAAPATVIYEENRDINQGLTYLASIPTENWLVKALYLSGLDNVYRLLRLPDHPYFRGSLTKRRRRTMLVAARQNLALDELKAVAEPRCPRFIWDRVRVGGLNESDSLRGLARRIRR